MARYTYSPGYIDSPAVQERDLNADGDFGDSGEVVYYHANTLYSVYALSDGSENVVERYRYNAYGQATVLDADWSADADGISDVSNPYAFTARRLDAENGLMQYRHRYYSTQLGRFVSRDPIGYADGPNRYAGHFAMHLGSDPFGLTRKYCCTRWEPYYQVMGYSDAWTCARELVPNRFREEFDEVQDPDYSVGGDIASGLGDKTLGLPIAGAAGTVAEGGAQRLSRSLQEQAGRFDRMSGSSGLKAHSQAASSAARTTRGAGRVAGAAGKALGAANAGMAVWGGGRWLLGRFVIWHALDQCTEEMCTYRYKATKTITQRRYWFDKVEWCCPEGGDLIDDFHATREPG